MTPPLAAMPMKSGPAAEAAPLRLRRRDQRVTWNWDIVNSCNYRCSYCFFAKDWEGSAHRNYFPGLERLLAAWDRIYRMYGSCHVHFAGGEPFIYPDFLKLLHALGAHHTLEVTTNLFWDVRQLTVPPEKIRIETSYHAEFAKFEDFLGKCVALRERGYSVGVTMVAAPLHLERYLEAKRIFQEQGFGPNLVPLRGKHYGKQFPDAYTDEERALLKMSAVKKEPQPAEPEKPQDNAGRKFYDWHVGKESARQAPERLCLMGSTYGKILPNGDVLRCCTTGVQDIVRIGNLYDPDFKLLDGPTPCSVTQCGCWKAMLVGQEEKWKPYWKNV